MSLLATKDQNHFHNKSRTVMPSCQTLTSDFGPGLFPKKSNGEPDYCQFYMVVILIWAIYLGIAIDKWMRKKFSPSRSMLTEAVVQTNLQGLSYHQYNQLYLIIWLWKFQLHLYKSFWTANQSNIIIINNFQCQRLMFRKCRFCICWIWVWIYLGYWVELGNFHIQNNS